jgi:hypothetical protein
MEIPLPPGEYSAGACRGEDRPVSLIIPEFQRIFQMGDGRNSALGALSSAHNNARFSDFSGETAGTDGKPSNR